MGIPELPEQLYVNGIFAMIYNVLNAFAFSLYNKTILITGSFIIGTGSCNPLCAANNVCAAIIYCILSKNKR